MKKHFSYRGHQYHYMNHAYNMAWLNERAVEVPIIQKVISQMWPCDVLEVGNVLSNYPVNYQDNRANIFYPQSQRFDILDKYETNSAPGVKVINADIVNYNPGKKYKLIVSISTMEHVGYDEEAYGGTPHTKHPDKLVDTIANIKRNLLKPVGVFVFTVPLGYNRGMDKMIFDDTLGVDITSYMHRITEDNRWQECTMDKVINTRYGAPYQFANAIAICTIYKS